MGLLGTNPSSGSPSITWATGPNGPVPNSPLETTSGSAAPTPAVDKKTPVSQSEPAAFYAPVAISNADDVIAVGKGPGSQSLKGFLDNTFIFKLMKDNL